MHRRRLVRVPASSANLGPGFDVLAAALSLHVELEVEETGSFAVHTDLQIARDRRNLAVRAFETLHPADHFEFTIRSEVPLSGGLGTSAAAYVAGLMAADSLFELDAPLLHDATRLEGHPDNAAAALLGGFTVSAVTDAGIESLRFDAPRDLRAVLFIPEVRLSTSDMRAALPAEVPLADAVANLSRVAIGVAGMALGRFDLLRVLTVDRLHEQYRATAYPELPKLVEAARKAGAIWACLSGAGSTILAFSDSVRTISRIEGAFGAAAADSDLPGRVAVVSPRNLGAHLVGRT
jgi:homoserine kinase